MALGFWVRLSTRPQLADGARVHALGSDDHYHLRRARFAVASFPKTIVFDRFMNSPDGGVPIWPPLYDLLLAAPSRVLHGPAATREQIESEAAWVPPVLAAATIAVAGAIGWGLSGAWGAAILSLFLALSPAHVMWTQYGHTDQHVAESFFGSLFLLLFLRARSPGPTRRAAVTRQVAAGLALAAAVLAWQGAIYWGAIAALALFLEAVRTRESVLAPALFCLALPAALAAVATALWLGPFRPPVTYVSFGLFQPLFLGALAGGTALLDTVLRASRRQLTRADAIRRAIVLGVAALALLPFAAPLAFGLARGFGYVIGKTSEVSGGAGYVSYPRDWLKGIYEARPLFADGPSLAWRQLSAAFFLTPGAIALWAVRARRGEAPGRHIALAVWGAVTLLLAISQRLNVYYAALLVGATLAEVARVVAGLLASRGVAPPLRRLAAAAAVLLLASPSAGALATEVKTIRVAGSDLFGTLDWMRRELPHDVDAYDLRLLEAAPPGSPAASPSAVMAPWSLGHLVLYEAELPVVANNFGYGFLDSIRFFLSENESEALAIARSRGVRWVVVTDLVPRMNDYAGYLGRPPLLETRGSGVSPTPRYFATIQSRLYDFDGAGGKIGSVEVAPLESFRLRFRSKSAIQRGDRWVARWKVFEIVPGPKAQRDGGTPPPSLIGP
jgi:asparagine N-glycosylation enzyme membrane subunit Stt3